MVKLIEAWRATTWDVRASWLFITAAALFFAFPPTWIAAEFSSYCAALAKKDADTNCLDVILNRYQTLFGVAVAVLVAWHAGRKVSAQIAMAERANNLQRQTMQRQKYAKITEDIMTVHAVCNTLFDLAFKVKANIPIRLAEVEEFDRAAATAAQRINKHAAAQEDSRLALRAISRLRDCGNKLRAFRRRPNALGGSLSLHGDIEEQIGETWAECREAVISARSAVQYLRDEKNRCRDEIVSLEAIVTADDSAKTRDTHAATST